VPPSRAVAITIALGGFLSVSTEKMKDANERMRLESVKR
jgi:hypothetical protein